MSRRRGRGRGRRPEPEGDRILTGRRFVLEGLKGGTIREIAIAHGVGEKLPELLEAAEEAGVPLREADRDTLDRLSGGVKHQGVVAIGPPYPWRSVDELRARAAEPALLVALDEITDPHNFGAIVRSAIAFGADGLLVPKHRAASVTPVVVRASAGATEVARMAKVTNLQRTLQALGDEGMQIVGLDMEGEVELGGLPEAPLGRVVVVGSEGKGLRRMVRERCTLIARIPQAGPVASLNASVAAGIALYEAARQRD